MLRLFVNFNLHDTSFLIKDVIYFFLFVISLSTHLSKKRDVNFSPKTIDAFKPKARVY